MLVLRRPCPQVCEPDPDQLKIVPVLIDRRDTPLEHRDELSLSLLQGRNVFVCLG